MAPPDDGTHDAAGEHRSSDATGTAGPDEWIAESALRVALVTIGLVIVLFALGQAVGLDLLGTVTDVLATQLGRWLIVAFFGLLLIVVAVRGFGAHRE